MSYLFEDCLDDKGSVSRAKLANCTFARLRPGDYVSASFSIYDEGYTYERGCVFAKVVSVQMPKSNFFSSHPGGVLVELPDGSRVEFLSYDLSCWNSKALHQAYHPTPRVEQHFEKACFPESRRRGRNDFYVVAYPADKRGELKNAMTKEQERRKRRQEELNRQAQANAAAAQAARQRAAEEARRNAAVSDKELDNLFRGR